jgi:hypothetical protein
MGDNFRMDRIERLLKELQYECERGMMEGEIDESLSFRFVVPVSKAISDGVVLAEFRSRPVPRYAAFSINTPEGAKLRVVE